MFRLVLISFGILAVLAVTTTAIPTLRDLISEKKTFPFDASLEFKGRHHCGSTIIADQIVLTAAHCVHNKNKRKLKVRAGTIVRESGGQVVNVAEVKIHPRFNPRRNSNDYNIAIIKLERPLKMNHNVAPIKLARSKDIFHGKTGDISGWGAEKLNGGHSRSLLYASIPVLDHETCRKYQKITKRSFCAGALDGTQSPCTGDEGGSIVIENKLAGVISWDATCGRKNLPAIFTNVAYFRTWIDKSIKDMK